MQTPSPQGIASLYMGNPGALQQKVNKEQKANPGLPPDLKDLMALNIVTNEQDAAKRQEALSALHQMAPGGQPPTVAQSIQEQAKQKLQAQMMQQAQQAQMAQQAQAAPQSGGIDQLPAELHLAGGGIVAFKKGDEVEKADKLKKQAEEDRAALGGLWDALKGGSESAGRAIMDVASLIPRGLAGAYDTAVVRPMRAAGLNAGYLSPHLTPEGADVSSMTPFADVKRRREMEAQQAATPAAEPSAPAQTTATPQQEAPVAPPQNRVQNTQAARPAAAQPPQPPQAAAEAPTGLNAAYQKYMEKGLGADPEVERAKAVAAYEKAVGKADTSQYDRMLQELETRKAQFNKPAAGFDAFAELMQNIANQGPQRTWYESGAKGAAAQIAMDKERQAQQFELTKQAVDVAQKKLDADRAYRKELYTTGADAAKRVEEIAKETAKEFGLDARQKELIKKDLQVANIHAEATKTAAKIGAEARSEGGADKQRLNELKALQKQYSDDVNKSFNKADKEAARRKLAVVEAEIAKMAGLGTIPGTPGAGSSGGVQEGATSTSKSGKPIVFRNGQWEYK